jgi:hypothetical protein
MYTPAHRRRPTLLGTVVRAVVVLAIVAAYIAALITH